MPAMPGFDAVKESRKWKRASALRLAKMTPAQQDAHFAKLRKEHAARRAALLRGKRALHPAH